MVRELRVEPPSERALKCWGEHRICVACIFAEYPERAWSRPEIYSLTRTWFVDNELTNYSENAVRTVLWRLKKKGYIKVVRSRPVQYFRATTAGKVIFPAAKNFLVKYRKESSPTAERVDRLEPSSSPSTPDIFGLDGHEGVDELGEEALIGLMVKEFSQIFGRTWFEQGKITFKIDHWLANQVAKACSLKPKTKRGSYREHEADFTLSIWPSTTTTILRPKRADAEKALVDWLVKEAGFKYGDLRAFFLEHGSSAAKVKADCRDGVEVSGAQGHGHGYAVSEGGYGDVSPVAELLSARCSVRGNGRIQRGDGLAEDDRGQRSNDLAEVQRAAGLHTVGCCGGPGESARADVEPGGSAGADRPLGETDGTNPADAQSALTFSTAVNPCTTITGGIC